eukprot:gnl/TRDRNA2_/TRDRNA2_202299_c0_seq1.p1 gnl/TRDRNA2_/TRDRNA2_202299_c0~~gnl/TRDRNA2_/TRDRNA2_202299_c0_seq1.p1  ORF type:complete len:272 (+),score=23.11 gnl/TRDRNA2_/TRDRNA2_202299_c0_seq1:96-911(+)
MSVSPAHPPASVSFVAGLIAGVSVDVPLHPIDTVKTRLQAQVGFRASGGYRNLWSGLSAMLATSVPGSALFFVVYDRVHHTAVSSGAREGPWLDAVAAASADTCACVARVPCEVVKQRMQASVSRQTLMGAMRGVAAGGFRGFYAGFGATVGREVPFALIQMPLFESLKRASHDSGLSVSPGIDGMMCGSISGMVAGAATTPLDAIKTQIMLTEQHSERPGLGVALLNAHRKGGLRDLFRGVLPRTVYCGIGGALWLGAFEMSKSYLLTPM